MKTRLVIFFIFSFSIFYLVSEDTDANMDSNTDPIEPKIESTVSDEFYSIQKSALTACYGDRWFVEELNDEGKISVSILYEKDKLLEKKEYFYEDDYKKGLNIFLEDKVIKIKYNKAGYETEKCSYDKSGNTLIEKIINKYDKNHLVIETVLEKDGNKFHSTFTYTKNNKKNTQTDFLNDEKICFVEYKSNKKIIHLFQFGKKIKVLEEDF